MDVSLDVLVIDTIPTSEAPDYNIKLLCIESGAATAEVETILVPSMLLTLILA